MYKRNKEQCIKRNSLLLHLYQVEQSNVAIKEQFGKFVNVLEPGCHFLPWCLGYQIAGGLSLRVQQLDVKCGTKTKVFASSFPLSTMFHDVVI